MILISRHIPVLSDQFEETVGFQAMKRLLLPACIIIIAIVLFSAAGNSDRMRAVPDTISVSEAAYSVRTEPGETANSFLVGRFAGNQGTNLTFDGAGAVKQTMVNLDGVEGSYTLTQSRSGAALLQLALGDSAKMYSFELTSPEGDFRLTDADGNTEIFRPVL